ncbi:hypothetical protein QO002_000899 [Pararhizobium capsulatum DSM 1112]|uniref:Helix-turn-helix domain-containing protein n=1 Tax=Pararhizobium capsulatum DSM 1112 TaxID=1121113 RepID=A0ABU0BKI5_9HYPH|nr:MarR family winged helix-turn-helix transcriptional regulator [Pararhizobium capsulatum]MDQ0318761.1 hypothetical protein [Pararhizobium capsulatum DSM 1112]
MSKVTTLNFFVALPGRVLSDDDLTALDFRVLGVVAAHDRMGRNGQCCWAGQKKLAAMVKCDPTRLSNSLSKLVNRKYLQELRDENDKRRKGFRVIYVADKDAAAIGSKVRDRLPDGNVNSASDRLPDGNASGPDRLPNSHLNGNTEVMKGKINQALKSAMPNPNIFCEAEHIPLKGGFGGGKKPPDRVLADLLGNGDSGAGWNMLTQLPDEVLHHLRERYAAGDLDPGDLLQARDAIRKAANYG